MNTLIIILLILIGPPAKENADIQYPVSDIPEELKEGVDVVVRMEKIHFNIIAPGKATLQVHKVLTIMDEDGDNSAVFYQSYDQFSKIKDIRGWIYNEDGIEIEKLKREDIIDRSYVTGGTFVGDGRIKAADLRSSNYPYTIEYSYEIDYSGLLYYPSWYPVPGEDMSIQRSSFSVEYSLGINPRYKEINFDRNFNITTGHSSGRFFWTLENAEGIEYEPYSKGFTTHVPFVLLAPSRFEIDGASGSMNSWEDFGLWNYELNEGRDILPEETVNEIIQMTSGTENEREKAKIIYEFMQSKTRYVSIQLGIGGWQTYPADFVDESGWGDCKALTNYTQAMLKVAGINSNWALVAAGSGEDRFQPDFPSLQFNHVILNVPFEKDTVWLECTSQQVPFGYLGKFTGDRNVLLLTEDGGKLARTPRLTKDENLQTRIADITFDKEGNANAKVTTTYTGIQSENNGLSSMINKSHDEQKKWLYNRIDIPNFTIGSFTFSEEKSENSIINEDIELTLRDYASTSGKRIFVNLNPMNKREFVPKALEERTTNVFIKYGYTDIDTIRYHLPEGIHPEYIPDKLEVESEFGVLEMDVIVEPGIVTYIRKLEMWKNEYPPEAYNRLIKFYKDISKADKSRMVFLKST